MDIGERQQILDNIQTHITRYLGHSYWFARFLRALRQGNNKVLALLGQERQLSEKPKYMRLTFYYYNFSEPQKKRGKDSGGYVNRWKISQCIFYLLISIK
ncbi:MAG: hypothetical protein CM1200mP10_23880 [Candidatus Neomarinimicrobiota bacterium]|nr:MAG: hypothetical protein CM1200mP10_23880 [Candidatus Neomarinimicrobiota bacterium]